MTAFTATFTVTDTKTGLTASASQSTTISGYTQPAVDGTHVAMAGTDLRTPAHALSGRSLLIPAGTFTLPDFADPQGYVDGLRVAKAALGFSGAGVDKTIITPAVNGGTFTPPTSGTNPACIVQDSKDNYTNPPSAVYEGFTLKGSAQATTKLYNGMRIASQTNPVVRHAHFLDAGPGNSNQPPGETFQLATNATTGALISDVLIEATVGTNAASPIGANNDTNIEWDNVTVRSIDGGPMHSMPTFWNTSGIVTRNLVSQNTNTGINHEEVRGTIRHYNPTLKPERVTTPYRFHMAFANTAHSGDLVDCEIHFDNDISQYIDTGFHQGCLTVVLTDTNYSNQYGLPIKLTPPKVYVMGRLLQWIEAPISGYTGPVMDRNTYAFWHHT